MYVRLRSSLRITYDITSKNFSTTYYILTNVQTGLRANVRTYVYKIVLRTLIGMLDDFFQQQLYSRVHICRTRNEFELMLAACERHTNTNSKKGAPALMNTTWN